MPHRYLLKEYPPPPPQKRRTKITTTKIHNQVSYSSPQTSAYPKQNKQKKHNKTANSQKQLPGLLLDVSNTSSVRHTTVSGHHQRKHTDVSISFLTTDRPSVPLIFLKVWLSLLDAFNLGSQSFIPPFYLAWNQLINDLVTI